MNGIRLIFATIVVIGAMVNFVKGAPRIQLADDFPDVYLVDEDFAFDGPFSGSKNQPEFRPPMPASSSAAPVFVTDFPTQPPVIETTSTTTTQSPVTVSTTNQPTAPPTFGPGFAAQPQGFIKMTPAPEPLRPEVAQCASMCQFQVTSEFNPVCGNDGVIYTNNGLLNCVKNCGSNVELAHVGRCSSNS